MSIPSRRPETGHSLDIVRNTMAGSGEEYVLLVIEAPHRTVAIEVDLAPVLEALGVDEQSDSES